MCFFTQNHLLFSLTCDIRRALEDLNEALKLQPNAADVMYVVAMAYASCKLRAHTPACKDELGCVCAKNFLR